MGLFSSRFGLVSGRIADMPKPESLGECTMVASPTPFNRFVMARSPTIDFSEIDFLKFIKQDGPNVKLNRKIIEPPVKCSYDEDIEYQRLYVTGDDGGILSLDLPLNLDIEKSFSSGFTILIIPGTVDGSGERKIKSFVCNCLRRNIFPIVMNPRGCAGTRLTTPRLFTAADSNDVSVVVQYISTKRPHTTLMAVAWDYSANILTKYLAESGNETPLVAATCIDNPFDLEEATKYKVYDEQTDSFIGILQANMGIFHGRGNRFDVRSALSASSILDFDRAISMVSYGFDNIEDFYAKSSTGNVIDKVKVHVLFIQNDDVFYIPRSSIAENPNASLLLYSFNPSRKIDDDRLTLSWCQHLILEWLMAVELMVRHPPRQPQPSCLETPPFHPPPENNSKDLNKDRLENEVMVGAVTAALGASALIAHQHSTESEIVEPLDEKEKGKESVNASEMPEKTEKGKESVASPESVDASEMPEKTEKGKESVVSPESVNASEMPEKTKKGKESVASPDSVNESEIPEKTEEGKESVASPVKEDSEVDHERLAEIGQKGGVMSSGSKETSEKAVVLEYEVNS